MTDGSPVPATQPRSYTWIESTEWMFACCITVVTETSTARVLTVLGLNGLAPRSMGDCDAFDRAYGIVELGSGSVLIVREFEYFDDDLPALARSGRLGRFFWNQGGLTLLTLARKGEQLERFEPLLEQPHHPEVVTALAGMEFAPGGYTASVLQAIEKFTGAGFTRRDMESLSYDDSYCWYQRPASPTP